MSSKRVRPSGVRRAQSQSRGSRSPGFLTSEVWIARNEFELDGNIPSDPTLVWNVDNWASIWLNGHEIVTHAGGWPSASQTPIDRSFLQQGTNTIAVEVFQDNNTNTWSVNPTFFQARMVIGVE